MAWKSDFARVENAKVVGTNVILFELVVIKNERFFATVCYFPLPDKEGKIQRLVDQALRDKPAGSMPLVIGDLNANLDAPQSQKEELLVQDMERRGLGCMLRHFQVRPQRRVQSPR